MEVKMGILFFEHVDGNMIADLITKLPNNKCSPMQISKKNIEPEMNEKPGVGRDDGYFKLYQ